MKSDAAFGGAQGQVMLHPISAEDFDFSVVAPDGHGERKRTFGVLNPVTFGLRELQIICDLVELLTGHLKYWMIINLHRENLVKSVIGGNGKLRANSSPAIFFFAAHFLPISRAKKTLPHRVLI